MADYFLLLKREPFEDEIRPALAAAWRGRSFEPCRAVCAGLIGAAEAFAQRYHTGAQEPFVARVASGLRFDRDFWRMLTGEILLVAASDIPEFQTCPQSLCCLLCPEMYASGMAHTPTRPDQPPVLQAHHGSRDLTFGPAVYRPDAAGYNNAADVARLAEYLSCVRPKDWRREQLHDLQDDAEQAEELAFAREWFPALRDLYTEAQAQGRVVVCERIP
jgi:hypothetical protein